MAHPAYRGTAWQQVRMAVLDRDGWQCKLCGGPIDFMLRPGSAGNAGTADHIVPVALGGAWHDPSNLRAAHVSCNRARGARSLRDRTYPAPRAW